jgi:hypothetical protein
MVDDLARFIDMAKEAAPMIISIEMDKTNEVDTANPIVASPNTITARNMIRPTRRRRLWEYNT